MDGEREVGTDIVWEERRVDDKMRVRLATWMSG